MIGWITRLSMQFRILVLAVAAAIITFGAALLGLLLLLQTAVRSWRLAVAIFLTMRQESPEMSRAEAVMMAARERTSPSLKSALITLLVLIPPALLGGTAGQALMAPMLLVIAGGLVTTTLVGLFVLPLLTLWFGPRTAPEEWSEVYEPEVPVSPVMPEKVEA